MQLELTEKNVALLLDIVNKVNWSGEQIEIAYELKKKLSSAIAENKPAE